MTDLGTARGRVVIDPSGAVHGAAVAKKADDDFRRNREKNARMLQAGGKVMAGAGLAIAAGLGVAIKTAATFEQRISAIGAVSGASTKQLEGIRKKALQLGADTVFSAKEAAEAMEELVKAGVPLADVMSGAADATVSLAAAGEVELAEAAEIAGNALNNFNLEGKDMVRVADLIAGAANSSSIDVHEFGESMKQAGSAAALVGLSFDDMAVAITAMGTAGIKGSDAGTSLKTFLLNLQPTTAKQTSLMKELGIITEDGSNKFFDAQGNIKEMADIAGVLNTALAGMTKQQQIATLETLFGSDAIRAAAIITKTGAEGFRELSGEMTKVSAADVAAAKMDNLAGSIEALKGSFETILIVVGTGFQPVIRRVADTLTELGNKFLALNPQTQKLIGTIAAVSATVLILVGGLALLIGTIAAGGPLITGLGVVIGAILSPIGLLIAGAIALGAGLFILYKKNETFRNAIQAAWEWIQAHVYPVIQLIITGVKALGDAFRGEGVTSDGFVGVMERIGVALRAAAMWITGTLIPAIQDMGRWLRDVAAPAVLDWITGSFIPAVQSLARWITGTAIPAVIEFAGAVRRLLGAAFKWLQENVFPIFTDFGALVAAVIGRAIRIIQILSPIVTSVFTAVMVIISKVMNIIGTVIEAGLEIMQTAWQLFGDNILDAVQIAFNYIKRIIEATLQIIRGIIQVTTAIITGDWSLAWDGIKNIFSGVWAAIQAVVELAINTIALIIRTALDLIHFLWTTAWTLIHATITIVWDLITGAIRAALELVGALIRGALDLIARIWFTAWHAVHGVITDVWGAIKSGVGDAIDWVQEKISGVLDTISGTWNDIWNGMGNALGIIWGGIMDIVRGGVNGVIDVINWFIKLINNIPGVSIDEIGHVGQTRKPSLQLNPGQAGVARGRAMGGFMTDGPQYVVGEGNRNHPEAVIATDPKYRKRNLGLLAWAAQRMGVPGFARGGIPNPVSAVKNAVGAVTDKIEDFTDDIRRATLLPLYKTGKTMINALPIPGGWGEQLKNFGKAALEQVYNWAAGKADSDAAKRDREIGLGLGGAGGGSAKGLVGFAANAFNVFRKMFPGMVIGGWRPTGSVPGSDHPKGKALDLMTTNPVIANTIIARFMSMAGKKYWIWNRQIATAARGWDPRPYSGPSPHTDHVHLSFLKKGGILSYLNGGRLMEDLHAVGASGQRYMLHRGETVTSARNSKKMDDVGNVTNLNLTVYANTKAGGEAAAKSFVGVLKQKQILTSARTA